MDLSQKTVDLSQKAGDILQNNIRAAYISAYAYNIKPLEYKEKA